MIRIGHVIKITLTSLCVTGCISMPALKEVQKIIEPGKHFSYAAIDQCGAYWGEKDQARKQALKEGLTKSGMVSPEAWKSIDDHYVHVGMSAIEAFCSFGVPKRDGTDASIPNDYRRPRGSVDLHGDPKDREKNVSGRIMYMNGWDELRIRNGRVDSIGKAPDQYY
jgi:hypothetical protein